MLPVDRSYHVLSGIGVQMKVKGKRKAYCCTVVMMHIMSMFQNGKQCKNNVVLDNEITSETKRAIADNKTAGYRDELMKNKAPVNVDS